MSDLDDEDDFLAATDGDLFDVDDEFIGEDDSISNDGLFLDREGFEDYELMREAPAVDYDADFAKYMADEALFSIFPSCSPGQMPEEIRGNFEGACEEFVEGTLAPAVEEIGGWGWFGSAIVHLFYDMLTGEIWLTLDNLSQSSVESDPVAMTQFALVEPKEVSEKEALRFDGEMDIEVDKLNVVGEANLDEGEGDLAEWIFDAMTNALQKAGRGLVDVDDMDQIADKCADICGQDVDKFGTLKFHVEDDGSISDFDFNGSHYTVDL